MDDDAPVFVYLANRTQGAENFGGHLVVTRTRILFTPTPKNEELGAEHWAADLSQVEEVGTKSRTWNLRDGGLRTRLRVTLRSGQDELFVVAKVHEAVAQLSGLLNERAVGSRN